MAGQRQCQFVFGDADAVVADANELDATFFKLDLDGRTAGVECVFQEFLEHGGRAFDDFASRNLANQQIGEQGNGRQGVGRF